MPRKIVIVQGHPDPAGGRLCHTLADAYAESAIEAGHEVSRIELAKLDFPLLRTQAEFEKGAMPQCLVPARDSIKAADHLVILFPIWLGAAPALLKEFLEQVMRPGFAFEYLENGSAKTLMNGRSARVIVTMGMPSLAYRLFYFAHGVSSLKRNILRFVGFKPVRVTYFGMAANVGRAKATRWFSLMRKLGAQGV